MVVFGSMVTLAVYAASVGFASFLSYSPTALDSKRLLLVDTEQPVCVRLCNGELYVMMDMISRMSQLDKFAGCVSSLAAPESCKSARLSENDRVTIAAVEGGGINVLREPPTGSRTAAVQRFYALFNPKIDLKNTICLLDDNCGFVRCFYFQDPEVRLKLDWLVKNKVIGDSQLAAKLVSEPQQYVTLFRVFYHGPQREMYEEGPGTRLAASLGVSQFPFQRITVNEEKNENNEKKNENNEEKKLVISNQSTSPFMDFICIQVALTGAILAVESHTTALTLARFMDSNIRLLGQGQCSSDQSFEKIFVLTDAILAKAELSTIHDHSHNPKRVFYPERLGIWYADYNSVDKTSKLWSSHFHTDVLVTSPEVLNQVAIETKDLRVPLTGTSAQLFDQHKMGLDVKQVAMWANERLLERLATTPKLCGFLPTTKTYKVFNSFDQMLTSRGIILEHLPENDGSLCHFDLCIRALSGQRSFS